MARRIVQQPNGLYALWSTVVDGFILSNATKDEIIQEKVEDAVERITEDVEREISRLDKTQPMSYYMEIVKSNETEEVYNLILNDITKGIN